MPGSTTSAAGGGLTPVEVKCLAACGLFFLGLLGGCLPLRIQGQERLLGILHMGAGGVFLAAGLVHCE